MDQNKTRRVALLLTFSAIILLVAVSAAAPLASAFICGFAVGVIFSRPTHYH